MHMFSALLNSLHALKIVMGLNVGLWGERCVLSACADWLIANVCQLYVSAYLACVAFSSQARIIVESSTNHFRIHFLTNMKNVSLCNDQC